MKKTTNIVLTGGPCAGKTSALAIISQYFSNQGFAVYTLPDAATLFNRGGVNILTDNKTLFFESKKQLLSFQLHIEECFRKLAEKADKPAIIVYDRGAMDIAAHMNGDTWQALLDEMGLNEVEVRDSHYDAVLHLCTAAQGAEQLYTCDNNSIRTENIEQAIDLDDKILRAWTGHPHLRVIPNNGSFEEKLNAVIAEISGVLGIPEPIEMERKFLVEVTGEIPDSREMEIFQTYLTERDGAEPRIRKRGENGHYIYFLTTKKFLADNQRIEVERQITPSEYVMLKGSANPDKRTIHKLRRCFVWDNRYWELDTFVEPSLPHHLLEIEDVAADEEIAFPPFVKVIREVTDDPEWYNANIAKRHKQYDN
jgi:CYTH domain-containing protein/predicted ATPase